MAIATTPTATTVTFSAPRQLSDQNSQGTLIGVSASDLVGFYGDPTLVPQQMLAFSSEGSASLQDNGTVTKYQATLTTASVAATTTAETTSTVTGILAADVIAINKPAAQAGLGIAGYRVSAANTIGVNYTNISSGAITPTSTDAYDVIGVNSNYTTSAVLTPVAVPATPAGAEQIFSVPGAILGSFPIVNKPTSQAGLGITNIRVSADDQVAITFLNNSTGAITPTAAETYAFSFLPTSVPSDRSLVYKFTPATTAVGASTTVDVTTAVVGLQADDIISGVSKPSYQTGLGIIGYRVSSAGNIAVSMYEGSSAVTTTLEAYSATVQRKVAKSPFVISSQLLTPVSVAATTTAEQTFTVNSLNASTSVLVSKPTFTPGIHVVGMRVSGASTLAITYQNSNTTAVIPPAETYTIAAIPLQGPGAVTTAGATTNSIAVGFNGSNTNALAIKNALVALNLMSPS